MNVEAMRNGDVVGSATSGSDGRFRFTDLSPGRYRVALAADNFREPATGVSWLGPSLVTPSIIAAYLWIWIGFAMIVIGAGLAAIPREVLEAARTDGANEWQVFRRVTAPLLRPVLTVVLITLVINVLKVFDLVFVIAPPSVQDDANVIALEMWRVSFGGALDQGLGSALAILLFVLVVPAMLFNVRRLRLEHDDDDDSRPPVRKARKKRPSRNPPPREPLSRRSARARCRAGRSTSSCWSSRCCGCCRPSDFSWRQCGRRRQHRDRMVDRTSASCRR